MTFPRGPLQQDPPVARDPSSGKGLAADEVGRGHISSKEGRWTMEYLTTSVDITNTNAHTGSSMTVNISGLAVGDLCMVIGRGSATRSFHIYTDAVCSTAGQITLHYFNADSAANDPASATVQFLVIHRNLIQ